MQRILKRVRAAIRAAAPQAEEVISYKIPAYKLHGRPIMFFAAWSKHYSLYPASGRAIAALADQLAPYQVSKGTIRIPLTVPVPVKLIARLVKFRAKEAATKNA